jgi:hypothetical protein
VRRFVILAAVFALVTAAVYFGPAIYPWTPAAERASRHEPFTSDPDLDELSPIRQAYREATELYRQGRFEEAEERYRAAAQSSGDLLRARAAYHRGNCLLGLARRQGAAVEPDLLHKAAEHYRECLNLAGKSAAAEALVDNARFNLEMTQLLLIQSARRPGPQPGLPRGPGKAATSAALAKASAASSGPRATVRAERPGSNPSLAGTEAPARTEKAIPELAKVPTAESKTQAPSRTEPAAIMVGPDGVIYRKVEDGAAQK